MFAALKAGHVGNRLVSDIDRSVTVSPYGSANRGRELLMAGIPLTATADNGAAPYETASWR
jgi:hypothetical protein